jgi:hypothetical protein
MSASGKQSVIFLWLGLCIAIVALWLGDAAIAPPKAEAMTLLADQSPSAVQTIMRGRIAFRLRAQRQS